MSDKVILEWYGGEKCFYCWVSATRHKFIVIHSKDEVYSVSKGKPLCDNHAGQTTP